MLYKNILVTGGAGFIGSFLVDKLIEYGFHVRLLDNLEEQVHKGKKPLYLNPKAEFIKGDVRDYNTFEKAIDGIDVVFHLAARVGVLQSNYKIKNYVSTNIGGMANLLDIVVNKKTKIKKILTLSSMTSYGEGNCLCNVHGVIKPDLRSESQLREKKWDIYCPYCNRLVKAVPTKEETILNNNSIYAITKNVQEELMMFLGKLYNIPVVSFRCFNVYGPRQSLSNPYTGVTAIFISRLKNNHQPVVYEDGQQSRDFVSIHDVVRALILAMEKEKANYEVMNIGSGKSISIREVTRILAKLLKKDIFPRINREFRKNDIRHCFADISKAKRVLGWSPQISLEEGMKELIVWSEKEKSVDLFEKAEEELRRKKLL